MLVVVPASMALPSRPLGLVSDTGAGGTGIPDLGSGGGGNQPTTLDSRFTSSLGNFLFDLYYSILELDVADNGQKQEKCVRISISDREIGTALSEFCYTARQPQQQWLMSVIISPCQDTKLAPRHGTRLPDILHASELITSLI